jgi:hypothetical protein
MEGGAGGIRETVALRDGPTVCDAARQGNTVKSPSEEL